MFTVNKIKTKVKTNNQLPGNSTDLLHSRESISNQQGYLDHWQSLVEEAPERELVLRQNHELLLHARDLMRNPTKAPDIPPSQLAVDWYLLLGSTNNLEGALPDLVHASGLIRRSGAEPKKLLIAGNMLHEATLLAPADYQDRLIGVSREQYEDVVYGEKGDLETRFRARGHLLDLDFTELRLHSGRLEQSKKGEHDRYYRGLQTKAGHLLLDGLSREQGVPDGVLAEEYYKFVARHIFWRDETYDMEEVRNAFAREDKPHDQFEFRGLPKWSFDVVHYVYGGENVKMYPKQIKVGGGVPKPNEFTGKGQKRSKPVEYDRSKVGVLRLDANGFRGHVREFVEFALGSYEFAENPMGEEFAQREIGQIGPSLDEEAGSHPLLRQEKVATHQK